jgi:crossover junction endodeoxyribonuclease RuvC
MLLYSPCLLFSKIYSFTAECQSLTFHDLLSTIYHMKLLAIDPGYDRCGVAVVEGQPATLAFSACITTSKGDPHEARLAHIYRTLETLIDEWQPQAIALETLFFSVNKTSAIKVAEARGVVLLLAGLRHLPVVELSPQEVKLSMTGIGNASKEQVQKMVALTLKIDTAKKIDDEVDAIALGIAAAQKLKLALLEKGLAKKK